MSNKNQKIKETPESIKADLNTLLQLNKSRKSAIEKISKAYKKENQKSILINQTCEDKKIILTTNLKSKK